MTKQKTFKEFISPPFLIEETEEGAEKKIREVDERVKKQFVAARTLENQMRKVFGKEIHVVCDDNPLEGTAGFTCFFTENDEEKVVRPLVPIFDRCVERNVDPASLEGIYDIAIENDCPVSKYDDPNRLRFGLIVTRHSGRTVYWSDYKDFYQYFQKREGYVMNEAEKYFGTLKEDEGLTERSNIAAPPMARNLLKKIQETIIGSGLEIFFDKERNFCEMIIDSVKQVAEYAQADINWSDRTEIKCPVCDQHFNVEIKEQQVVRCPMIGNSKFNHGCGRRISVSVKDRRVWVQLLNECTIYGVDKAHYFKMFANVNEVWEICHRIYACPKKYASCLLEDCTDPYHGFAKLIWVSYPDGKKKRLIDVIDDNIIREV